MLPPKRFYSGRLQKSWAPDPYELDSDLAQDPDAIVGGSPTDSEFSHQRFRNFLYVEFPGPRKTLIKLRNLCLDWLQPEIHTKDEIIELLVLEQFLSILPERIRTWVQARRPQTCEKLVSLLEMYREMYGPEDDSDTQSEDGMRRSGADSAPLRPAYFLRERDRDWDQDWDRDRAWDRAWDRGRAWERARMRERERRARSRELALRERWPYGRIARSRLPHRDLSLPAAVERSMATERGRRRRSLMMQYELQSQDAMSYQDMVKLTEDRKAQNSIKDNMENYRKLLFLGLRATPEARKSTHRRGICEGEPSHGVITEKFNKDAARNPKPGRAREPSDRFLRLPRRSDHGWREAPVHRESVVQGRVYSGGAFGGGFNCHPNPVPKKRVIERKRRYQFDADGKGGAQDQRGSPRKRPFECSDMRKAMSASGLSSPAAAPPPPPPPPPRDRAAMPYVCDECGRAFGVISEFVEHQIMHTRENLYEYGEAFIRSVAVARKSGARGKCFECKECGETFDKAADLAEHCKTHSREPPAERHEEEYEEPFLPSPTFSELQKMYGKDKFYECKVCKETFLHSSALVEHQKKFHGRDDKEDEAFQPNPALQELQRMCAKEKAYECAVCGETFRHGSSLKEHQKIHTRANLFDNKNKVCEETFVPGQPPRRRQKSYLQERLYGFRDDEGAFGQRLYLGEPCTVRIRNNFCDAKPYGKSIIRNMPFFESRKSHTITRPPENENERAFTISSNPDGNQNVPPKDKVLEKRPNERSVIHSLPLAEVQRGQGAAGPGKPKAAAEPTVTSSDGTEEGARAGEKTPGEKKNERSVIHSLPPVFKLPRSPSGNGGHEKGGAWGLSDQQQKAPARAGPGPEEADDNNNYKDSVIRRVSGPEPPNGPAAGGAGEFQEDGPERQKAPAKINNIERGTCETSVIHSLHFGEPKAVRPREKFYECPECGEAFVRSSDLTEHQKAHHRKKPFGGKSYERSVIRSLASADPRASYAQQPVPASHGQEPEGMTCIQQPGRASFLDELVEMSYVREPVQGYPQQPQGLTCIQQAEGLTCIQQAEGLTCIQQPQGLTCIQQAEGLTCIQQPQGLTCIQQPEGLTCLQQAEGLTCIQQAEGLTCIQQAEGLTCIQQAEGLTCIQQPEGLTCLQQPEGLTCIQQPMRMSFLEDLVEMSYVQEPVQTYGQEPVGMICAPQPEGLTCIQQPAQASYPPQPVGVSYAEPPARASYAQGPVPPACKDCGQSFATAEALGAHQRIYSREEFHGGSVIRGAGAGRPEQEEPEPEEEGEEEEDSEDSIYGCKDCGLGFADRADLKDHQKVHGREYLVDTREYAQSVIHTHSVSEYQRENAGEQLFECPACGESFVHSSFLFEHQKVHEQDPYYGRRRYEEPFLHPFLVNPQRFRAPQADPAGMYLQCHVCGQDFIHGSVFNEHLALHVGEAPPGQAQRSGAAVGAGLALAELQRGRAEEKRHECGACGEAFPSQSDLQDHKKTHEKDKEPYDYGASFVHTSFLTEPPKGDSPFFECKDCGKSFIHTTVLTKHQKFHVEEEEAAAQEVEANVLVPREVLRIQGSNAEAAEPEVETAEPEVEAAEPNVEAAEPNGEAEGPDGEAAEPGGEAEQPNGEAEQPNGDADEPDGAGIEDPEEREEELEGEAEEPEGDADEPDGAGIEDPEEEDEDQEIQVEEPYYDCRECGETFTTTTAYGEHRQTHARVIIFESGNVDGEGSHYTGHAGTSTPGSDRADDKYFKCDVCGQFFRDRLSLARHQNSHTG